VNARETPEMKRLIGKWGMMGYGVFLLLCELLSIQDVFIEDVVAIVGRNKIKPPREFVDDCIEFGVLTIDQGYIPCPFVVGEDHE
jgi:hypothetical protein